MNPTNAQKLVSLDLRQAHALLDRADRDQRRQSLFSLVTIVLLATALLSLWIVASTRAGFPGSRVAAVVVLYLVLVAVFARSSVRRQRVLSRRGREAASQLSVVAARETLDLILGKSAKAEAERRRLQRAACDEPLSVSLGDAVYYGRVCDLCEHGLGAIIPAALEIGTQVLLEFAAGTKALRIEANVRQRNGVRYGFEFVQIGDAECDAIENFRCGTPQSASMAAQSAAAPSQ